MTSQRPAPDHASHDLLLVAAHVAGDTSAAEASRARELLAVCSECREIAADLAAITAASRRLPAVNRSRDFRLTPEDAARIRGRSLWSRLVDGLLAPRGVGRAVPAALMTLGLAALMVSAIPGFPSAASPAVRDSGERLLSAPSSGPTTYDSGTGAEAASGGAPSPAKGAAGPSGAPNLAPPVVGDTAASPPAGRGGSPVPAAQDGGTAAGAGPTTRPDSPAPAAPSDLSADEVPSQGPPPLLVLAIVLVASGVVLIVARRMARARA